MAVQRNAVLVSCFEGGFAAPPEQVPKLEHVAHMGRLREDFAHGVEKVPLYGRQRYMLRKPFTLTARYATLIRIEAGVRSRLQAGPAGQGVCGTHVPRGRSLAGHTWRTHTYLRGLVAHVYPSGSGLGQPGSRAAG